MQQVTVYLTATSPYSKMLKDYLTAKSIPFTKKTIDIDQAARNEMVKDSGGFLGIPFIVIVKDDSSKETIVGFDKGKLNSVLGIQ